MLWTMGPRSELEIPKCLIPVPITLTGLSLVQRKPRCMPEQKQCPHLQIGKSCSFGQILGPIQNCGSGLVPPNPTPRNGVGYPPHLGERLRQLQRFPPEGELQEAAPQGRLR